MSHGMGSAPRVEVRRGHDRFVTADQTRTTRHSFSFDRHYDPANVAMGDLVAHNDDLVQPGHGYPPHPHRDLEIVTWVLSGALRHQDSTGRGGLVTPGLVQRVGAGSGIVHSEVNGGAEPVRFVQMWVRPDESGLVPTYDQRQVELGSGAWVALASGRSSAGAAVRLANRDATLHAARPVPGRALELPDAPLLHLFVARGRVEVEGVGSVAAGDAVRLFGGGGHRIGVRTDGHGPSVQTDAGPGSVELLVWQLRAPAPPG